MPQELNPWLVCACLGFFFGTAHACYRVASGGKMTLGAVLTTQWLGVLAGMLGALVSEALHWSREREFLVAALCAALGNYLFGFLFGLAKNPAKAFTWYRAIMWRDPKAIKDIEDENRTDK